MQHRTNVFGTRSTLFLFISHRSSDSAWLNLKWVFFKTIWHPPFCIKRLKMLNAKYVFQVHKLIMLQHISIMKRKFKQWWSSIPSISTQRTSTSHINWIHSSWKKNPRHMTLEIHVLFCLVCSLLPCFWIINSWLPLGFSLTFIWQKERRKKQQYDFDTRITCQ
jgi:hypothetical protein